MQVLPAIEVGQEKGDDTRADFLVPAASGASTVRSRTSGPGLSRKPHVSGRDFTQKQYGTSNGHSKSTHPVYCDTEEGNWAAAPPQPVADVRGLHLYVLHELFTLDLDPSAAGLAASASATPTSPPGGQKRRPLPEPR